jgi:hypothetical protein
MSIAQVMGGDLSGRIWNNGAEGWGIQIPELTVRRKYFDRRMNRGKIMVEVDGLEHEMNIDKESFWTATCGELIHKSIKEFVKRHGLKTGDRVHLDVLKPFHRYRLGLD